MISCIVVAPSVISLVSGAIMLSGRLRLIEFVIISRFAISDSMVMLSGMLFSDVQEVLMIERVAETC